MTIQNKSEPENHVESEKTKGNKRSLRTLFTAATPAAIALVLAACGRSKFGGSRSDQVKLKEKNDPNDGNLGAGGANKDNRPPLEESPPPASVSGETPVEPCNITGEGLVQNPEEDPTLDFRFVAYGKKSNALVVIKSRLGKIVDGDFVMLGEVMPDNKLKILARKRANSVDAAVMLIMFDGLCLGANAMETTPKLAVVVVKVDSTKRSVAWPLSFATHISKPTVTARVTEIGSVKYPIIDNHSQGHDNYWNTPGLNVSLTFGNPTSTIEGGVQFASQGDTAGAQTRKLQYAKNGTVMWPRPSGLPISNYYVCDAFGDVIVPVLSGGASAPFPAGNTDVLRRHSTLLFYVQDMAGGEHYHRYFYHVG